MRRLNDEGFTLVELLIVIVIMGVIVPALGAAVFSVLQNSNATTQRMVQSHDGEIATAFFANDVQSADVSPTATSPLSSTDTRCDNGSSVVVRLAWTEYGSGGSVTSPQVASYNLAVYGTSTGAAGPILRRYFCSGPSYAGPLSLISNVAIAANLASTTSATVSVASCPDLSPRGATLTVTDTAVGGVPGYVFSLSGTRRKATC